MQYRWAFVKLKLFLLSPLPLFLISMEKLNCLLFTFHFPLKQISFSSSVSFCMQYTITQHSPICTATQEMHFSLLLVLIWGALIFTFSLVLLKIREISQATWLRLQSSERSRTVHGHTRTQLFGRLTTSQPSLETTSTATISHPLGSHLSQWCHTDAARSTSANLVTKQRPWFYQIC